MTPTELRALMRHVERVLTTYRAPVLAPGYIEDTPDGGLYVASGAILDGCGWPLRHVAEVGPDGRITWEGCG